MKIDYNDENLAKIRKVADELQGSMGTLDSALEEEFGEDPDVDIRLLQELDSITMECENCGWWCETGEIDENNVCDDCREDA